MDTTDDFQSERTETLAAWRLPNSAAPVDENDFRQRLQTGARKANQAFDQLVTRFGKSIEDISPAM